jgi:lactoylglutathione lyase
MSVQFKMLHTMIRVRDLDASISFYCDHLKMNLIRRKDYPSGKFTLAFVGYGDEDNNTVVELTHNWDQGEDYDLGNGFGHIAIGVGDIYSVCEGLEKIGIEVQRKPGPMKHGATLIAFVKDPDGYMIELIEKK